MLPSTRRSLDDAQRLLGQLDAGLVDFHNQIEVVKREIDNALTEREIWAACNDSCVVCNGTHKRGGVVTCGF